VVAKNARVVEEVAIHKEAASMSSRSTTRCADTEVDVERLSDTDRSSGERGAMFGGEDRSDRR
jgi:hypothetical protein